MRNYQSGYADHGAKPQSQNSLEQLKAHPIFKTASERPLLPSEVDVYLKVKEKIKNFVKPSAADEFVDF
jgi:hypothetical protein